MRFAFNYFIPVLQDPISDENLNTRKVCTNVISNGYYGYQPINLNKASLQENITPVNTQSQDVFFTILNEENHKENIGEKRNRKRAWEYGDDKDDNKIRRESDFYDSSYNNQNIKHLHLHMKPPTHNVPDIPRHITRHYI